MNNSTTNVITHDFKAIAATVYALVGIPKGSKLPTHSHGYPLVYLTLKGNVVCAKCANTHKDDMNPVIEGGVHWSGGAHNCETCECEIESAYGV